jgi:hypothetical protein
MEMPGAFIPEQKPALRESSLQFLTWLESIVVQKLDERKPAVVGREP